jgi:hypothetical protein
MKAMDNIMPLYARSADAIFSEIEGEFVALNINKGQCYGMDSIASKVWTLIEKPRSLEDVCAELENLYAVEPDTCRADVESFLTSLSKEGLVDVQ